MVNYQKDPNGITYIRHANFSGALPQAHWNSDLVWWYLVDTLSTSLDLFGVGTDLGRTFLGGTNMDCSDGF